MTSDAKKKITFSDSWQIYVNLNLGIVEKAIKNPSSFINAEHTASITGHDFQVFS